jgi:flagellar capping protein FliD
LPGAELARRLLGDSAEGAVGTVGLSFGSPTSGAGFDVSATVSQIVTNLQKVETPWKNQLTALQSQDAAISSLGTALSKLSSDVSALTDFTGVLAQKTGSSSDTNVLQLTSASNSATAGTHTVVVNNLARTSSGYLAAIPSASDKLTGSITLQVGSGKARTISLPSSGETLASLAAAINSSGAGISASVLTDSSGSRLSLVSGSSGAKGNISITSNSIADTAGMALGYTGSAGSGSSYSIGKLAGISNPADTLSGSISIQVGSGAATKITLDSSNNTLATLASAITSANIGVAAQVVTNSDGSSSLSLLSGTSGSVGTLTVTSNITDPAPTLGYTGTVTGLDASLNVDGVDLTSSSNTVTNLIPGLTFQLLSASPKQSDSALEPIQVVIGNNNSGVETAINSMVTDYNALVSAINTQEGNDSSGKPEPLFGSPTVSLLQQQLLSSFNQQNPNGFMDAVATDTNAVLSGSLSIQVGSGGPQTVTLGSSQTSLSDLADAINSAKIGVTASVVTTGTQSNLYLLSQKSGSGGALEVSSSISAASDTLLGYSGSAGSTQQNSGGTLTAVPSADDVLTGSVIIRVGSGAAHTINLDSSHNTIGGAAQAINDANIGVIASVVSNTDGSSSLSLQSGTSGSAGTLTVSSKILDTTHTTATTLGYTTSSDISTLTGLGISMNNDGTISFDASNLDSLLNSDFNSVVGMFQSVNSWGSNFATMLNNAGTTSSMGILKLAQNSNSNIEKTLNDDITREEAVIADQQKRLTAQLNLANEILQALPSQLSGMDMLYSAITGYNQKNG